jgi:hypothetical protein
MVEIWKPVTLPNFAEHYEVSSAGRVRRVTRCKGRKEPHMLKGQDLRGYVLITLTIPKARTQIMLHRLVAAAFLGPLPPGLQVNHKDGNKANNAVDNLEYVTHAENIRHRDANGLNHPPKGEENGAAKLTSADVTAIRTAAANGASHSSLAATYGVSKELIHQVVRRKIWRHV